MLGLLLAGLITAAVPEYGYGHVRDSWNVELPPVHYRHVQRPVYRMEVPLSQINKTCWREPVDIVASGCTKWDRKDIRIDILSNPNIPFQARLKVAVELDYKPKLCVVVLPEISPVVPQAFQDSIWKHELVHCSGLKHVGGTGWYTAKGVRVPQGLD